MGAFELSSHALTVGLISQWCNQPWPCLAFEVNDGRIIAGNEAANNLYGCVQDGLVGSPIASLFKGKPVDEFVKELGSGRSRFCGIWEHQGHAGKSLFVELEGTCVTYEDRKICLLTIVEATGAGAMALRLDRTYSRYESIFNFAVDGIYQSTPEGRLLSANPAFASVLGYRTPEEVIRCLFPLQDKLYVDPACREHFKHILDRDGVAHDLEFEAYRKDRSKIWLSFNARSVKNVTGKTIYYEGFVQEVTRQKRTQIRLEKTLRELKQSNQELERFAYIASHDLQEPLRTVASYVMLVKSRYRETLDQAGKEYIDFAVSGVERMRQLIQDLLAYSSLHRKRNALVRVPVGEIVETVVQDLASAIEECHAAVESATLPTIPCDRAQIGQLFSNLIGNALKYRSHRPPKVEISCTELPHHFRFSVKDNGEGFDEAYSLSIFETFRRLHGEDYPGTGIGLAICKKIVERHGGTIWAESKVGEGSIFSFTLPKEVSPELA